MLGHRTLHCRACGSYSKCSKNRATPLRSHRRRFACTPNWNVSLEKRTLSSSRSDSLRARPLRAVADVSSTTRVGKKTVFRLPGSYDISRFGSSVETGGRVLWRWRGFHRLRSDAPRRGHREGSPQQWCAGILAQVAHELRQPLTAASAAARVLQMSDDDGPRQRAHVVLDKQFVRLGRLVEDILDTSRLHLGKTALRLERLDLRTVVEEATDSVGLQVAERQQWLQTQCGHRAGVDTCRLRASSTGRVQSSRQRRHVHRRWRQAVGRLDLRRA